MAINPAPFDLAGPPLAADRFNGKQSPAELFWHSRDLALARFSGRAAPPRPGADAVTAEAYSHELIAFGFWPGDERMRYPAFYSCTAPPGTSPTSTPAALADLRRQSQGLPP